MIVIIVGFLGRMARLFAAVISRKYSQSGGSVAIIEMSGRGDLTFGGSNL